MFNSFRAKKYFIPTSKHIFVFIQFICFKADGYFNGLKPNEIGFYIQKSL